MSLYEQISPKCRMQDLVLPEAVSAAIAEVLEDFDFVDALIANGLPLRRRILLHGPPGCGKTSLAHAIASHLKLKLYGVSLAQTVGSHIGESSKQAELIFQFAAQNNCVMLIDEFDSLGSERGGVESGASRENNRLVNTLLTCMENKPPLGLLVACTNLFDVIDAAVLRRFDLVVEIPSASRAALKQIAESIIKGRFGIRVEDILAEAATPAAVVARATDQLRRKVIEDEKQRRGVTLPLFDPAEEAKKIRKRLTQAKAEPQGASI